MFLVIVQVECSYVLMFDCLFYSNSILVHNKFSLYKEMWVKRLTYMPKVAVYKVAL